MKVKNRIRTARLTFRMSQSDLAALVGVSKNAISSYERGEYLPSISVALMFCEIFGCVFEWLFYFEEVSGDES